MATAITRGKGRARVAANNYYERCELKLERQQYRNGGTILAVAALLLMMSLVELVSTSKGDGA